MKFRRLLSILLAGLLLIGAAFAAKDAPIEDLALRLQAAQADFTAARTALLKADEDLQALEKKYDKKPNDAKLQDKVIDAMIVQEEAAAAFNEANAALLTLQAEQARLQEKAGCETLEAAYQGKYADLFAAVSVDENLVIYGLDVQVEGSERDRQVGENDYLYRFLGKRLPLSIGDRKSDDVAPLKGAVQTSKDLVAALNSLVYEEESAKKASAGPIIEPQDIADYLFTHGELPDNFITKKEAQRLGWDSSENYVSDVAPGKSIGGDRFGNYEGLLPSKKGRTWYEADCYYKGGKRNAHRIVYSSDGLVYYTDDHYETFTQMHPSK